MTYTTTTRCFQLYRPDDGRLVTFTPHDDGDFVSVRVRFGYNDGPVAERAWRDRVERSRERYAKLLRAGYQRVGFPRYPVQRV